MQSRIKGETRRVRNSVAVQEKQPMKQTEKAASLLQGKDINAVIKYVMENIVGSSDSVHKGTKWMSYFCMLLQGGLRPISVNSVHLTDITMESLGDHVSCILDRSVLSWLLVSSLLRPHVPHVESNSEHYFD